MAGKIVGQTREPQLRRRQLTPVCPVLRCRFSGRSGDRGPYASNGAADDPRSLSGDFLERADVCAAAAGFHVSPTRVRAGGLGINLRKRHRSPASLSACALPSSSPWLSPSLRSRWVRHRPLPRYQRLMSVAGIGLSASRCEPMRW